MRFPTLIAFVGSFCLMVLELVAGRMMAPYLGVSLYTWTSVIGVILAGISLGAYFGGRLADREANRKTLGGLFVMAGITALFALYFVPLFGSVLSVSRYPLVLSTLIFSIVTFLPPSVFLGCITPVLVKLSLHNLDQTGTTVGRISAAGAVGSIAGTFLTGYVFIALFGTKMILLAVAAVLLIVGSVVYGSIPFSRRFPLYVFLLGVGAFITLGPCTVESQYYCIRITAMPDGYVLRLDHLVHSYVRPAHAGNLGYQYEYAFANLLASTGKKDPRTLFIGGGGYVLPRYIETYFPHASITVAEIDPAVTRVNFERMELATSTRVMTANVDARRFLQTLPNDKQYDAIFGDAFNDLSVPYHLTTKEFDDLVRRHLSPDGFYAVNVIDDPRRGRFLASMIKTFRESFPEVALFPLGSDWNNGERNTYVLVGSEKSFTTDILAAAAGPGLTTIPAGSRVIASRQEIQAFLSRTKGIVLIDDHVPVETMLAPVFNDAYR